MAARRLTVPTCEAGEKIVGPFVDCAKALVGSASKAQTRSTRDEYDMGRWVEEVLAASSRGLTAVLLGLPSEGRDGPARRHPRDILTYSFVR